MGRVLGTIFYGLAALTALIGIWLMSAFDGGTLPGAEVVAFISIGIPTFGSALALLFFGYVCFALDGIVERMERPSTAAAIHAAPPDASGGGTSVVRPSTATRPTSGASVKGRVAA